MKVSEVVTTKILDYTQDGLGIGKLENNEKMYPIFIPNVAIGDVVEVRLTKLNKSYGFGIVEKIKTYSKDRIKIDCPVYEKCGGCSLKHISYEAQLLWKKKAVSSIMKRIGGFNEEDYILDDVIKANNYNRYRNKAQYPIGKKEKNGIVKYIAGFYEKKSHKIVDMNDCMIEHKKNANILKVIKEHLKNEEISTYDESTKTGLIRHVIIRTGFYSDEIMVAIVVNAKNEKEVDMPSFLRLANKLKDVKNIASILINFNDKKNNVILGEGEKLLYGKQFITDRIGEYEYKLSLRSFYQVNPEQTVKLYNKAIELATLKKEDVVWDLYCGIGTITIFMADKVKEIYGVEVVKPAILNAIENAKINNIKNATFICGEAERLADSLKAPDVIVVDPPRKGMDEKLIDTILNTKAKKLIYISCNPSTFARDLKKLCEEKFTLKCVVPVDMFPNTTGIECIGLITRK